MTDIPLKRISLPALDEMTPAQKRVYDAVVTGPRGRMIGPLRAVIHSPDLADRWQSLGEYLRYKTIFPEKLKEFAIITVARRWNAELEWTVHSQNAQKAGLAVEKIEALRQGQPLPELDEEEAEIFAYCREIQTTGRVSDPVYAAILKRWGEQGVVELTGIVGYYTMVAMTLNAHAITLPDDLPPRLYPGGETPPLHLTELSPT